MKRIILLVLGAALLSGCAAGGSGNSAWGPYSQTYGVPTLAATAAGAAIGYNIGPKRQRGQNAVIGGIIGALAGTAAEHAIYNQNVARQEDMQRKAYQEGRQAGYQEYQREATQPQYQPQYYQPPSYQGLARVNGTSSLNIRSGPSSGYHVVGSLGRGQTVQVLQFQNGWALVQVPHTGLQGWVSGRYLSSAAI